MTLQRYRNFAWFTLGYMILVILWGAFVRASGSGAGCGEHWPMCNGQVIPVDPSFETLVEISHRVTSGLALLLVFALFVLSRRLKGGTREIQSAARWSLIFIVIEALIGAVLVLFAWVGTDQSSQRAVSMSAHLLNTFFLLGALTLLIFRSGPQLSQTRLYLLTDAQQYKEQAISALLLILTGMTGAIAALGDTLYAHLGKIPIDGYFIDGFPVLMRLRLIHPVVALGTVVFLLWSQARIAMNSEVREVQKISWFISATALLELILGLINVYLMAPIWLQLVHLAVAVVLWILFCFQCFVIKDKDL